MVERSVRAADKTRARPKPVVGLKGGFGGTMRVCCVFFAAAGSSFPEVVASIASLFPLSAVLLVEASAASSSRFGMGPTKLSDGQIASTSQNRQNPKQFASKELLMCLIAQFQESRLATLD